MKANKNPENRQCELPGHVAQHKFSRQIFGSRDKIVDLGFGFMFEQFFGDFSFTALCVPVIFETEQIPGMAGHWGNMTS